MKSKLSKALVLLLSLAMIVAQFVIPTSAADQVACDDETHARGDITVSSVPATCVYYGYDVKECEECGGLYIQLTETPTGVHDVVNHPAQAATCTEIGWDAYETCNDCDYTTYAEIPATGHSIVEVEAQAPDCTNIGWEAYEYCTNCEYTTYVEIPATGHTPGEAHKENEVAPNCSPEVWTDGGYDTVVRCTVCDAILSSVHTTIPVAHDYKTTLSDGATCDTAEELTYTCQTCGYTFVEELEAPLGHHVVVDPAVPATCTTPGLTEGSHCDRCDTVLEAQVDIPVDPLSHKAVVTVPGTAATCTETGLTDKVECADCGLLLSDQIVTPIDPDNHIIVHHEAKAPTCTEVGWEAYDTCGREGCDYTTYVEIPANGHTWVDKEGKAATCEEDGYTAYQECSVCGEIQNYADIPALGHNTVTTLGVVPPTCTQDGFTVKYCDRCDQAIKTDIVEKLGHDLVPHDAQAATCTDIGWNAYDTCQRADCDYTTYVEIPALGHYYQAVVTDPTCTEQGYTTHTCSRCDDAYVDEFVDALGHTEVIDPAVEATFDETGLTEGKHCSVCGEVLVAQDETPMKQENITFTYEATGIKDSTVAVNSGYITLNVYLNVNSEIARLYGAQLGIDFTNLFTDGGGNLKNALTLTKVEGSLLDTSGSTDLVTANNNKKVVLAQDMGINGGVAKVLEEGKYLFATLTFKVNSDFYGSAVSFDVVDENCRVSRNLANILEADFGEGAELDVIQLGDANEDGVIDSLDMLDLAIWYDAADLDSYETVYDLDKNGEINGDDFALLRGAIVGNNGYLG